MGSGTHVVVVSESAVAPELWSARKTRISGWLEQLQGLAEAGPGKVLKIGPLDEKAAQNRWAQIQSKAKKAGLKVERALSGDFFYLRIVGAPEKAAIARSEGQADRRSLPELVLASLVGTRWRNTSTVAYNVMAMDAGAAKQATASMVGDALSSLYKAGKISRREEEGIVTWRGPAKA